MDTGTIERALTRLGEVVVYRTEIEMLVVGGAAGMLTGVFSRARTTTDCDVMIYSPQSAMVAVEAAAASIASEFGIAPNWLNSNVQMRSDALPDGWRRRRILIGAFGKLQVWAASRPDLIAMKVLAGRPQDIVDLQSMRPSAADIDFVRAHMRTLAAKGTPGDQIDDATTLLNSLRLHEG